MTDEKALTTVSPYAIMPVMDIRNAVERRRAIIQFTSTIMVEGQHFGKVPGTDKNTLLKPGAEMLTTFFGLSPRFEVVRETLDWTGVQHNGEAFFYFQYRCQLWRGDLLVGDGLGSCNSWEKKYRYRTSARVCPNCGAEAIIKGKADFGGGWLCWGKKGGCGAKFPDGDPAIEGQETGQVVNDNPADLVNTIDKMAQKRALIAATLIAVNASEFFTQDLEDLEDWGPMPDTTNSEQPGNAPQTARPAQRPAQAQPQRRNGGTTRPPARPSQTLDRDPVNFTEFWQYQAFKAIGYSNRDHVQNAVKLVWPDRTLDSFSDAEFAEFWAQLKAHHEATVEAVR
jgi:hypothetical protein